MRSELKNGVRHLYDSPDITFGELLNKARKVELEDTEMKGITKVQLKAAPMGSTTVVPVQIYTVLKPGSTRIKFGLRNLSARAVTIKCKTAIARFAAANAIPDMLAPSVEEGNQSAKRGA